jgi:Lectin C-type domain
MEATGFTGHWIGLNSLISPENPRVFNNSDGSLVTYTPWIGPQLTNRSGDIDCVFAKGQSIQAVSCSDKRPYVCMAPLQPMEQNPSDCIKAIQDPGCRLWGHGRGKKCYYFGNDPSSTFGTRQFETFEGARSLCRRHFDADLIVINDAEEQEFLTGLFGSWAADSWIGLKEEKGQWNSFSKWINGDEVALTNWGKGQPQIRSGKMGCVALHSTRTEENLPGDWYVAKCEDPKFAICEGPREGWTATTKPSSGVLEGCPKNWIAAPEGSRNCYKVCFHVQGELGLE